MSDSWPDFLAAQGAVIAEDRVQHFGNAAAELAATASGSVIADLSHLGLLALTGADAATFLQGQLTNDVLLLDGSNSQYAGYCTAKGRLLATLLLWKHADTYYAQLDGGIAPDVMRRLGMYVLRSKVSISDARQAAVRFGISGKNTEKILETLFSTIPQQAHQLSVHGDTIVLRLPGVAPRFEIIATPDNAPDLWKRLAQQCMPAGAPCWEWLDIRAGIPQITAATQEEFVPQMVNLDTLGGINFKKGCYAGQEIVARTHYLGKVKRRTHLAHIDVQESPKPGDPVFGSDSAEPVGMVVNVAPAPQGGYDLLAEIRLESVAAGAVRLVGHEGPALEQMNLPYSL